MAVASDWMSSRSKGAAWVWLSESLSVPTVDAFDFVLVLFSFVFVCRDLVPSPRRQHIVFGRRRPKLIVRRDEQDREACRMGGAHCAIRNVLRNHPTTLSLLKPQRCPSGHTLQSMAHGETLQFQRGLALREIILARALPHIFSKPSRRRGRGRRRIRCGTGVSVGNGRAFQCAAATGLPRQALLSLRLQHKALTMRHTLQSMRLCLCLCLPLFSPRFGAPAVSWRTVNASKSWLG